MNLRIFLAVLALSFLSWFFRDEIAARIDALRSKDQKPSALTAGAETTELRTQLTQLFPPTSQESAKPSPGLIALGEKLFHETRFSRSGQTACASCHIPEKSFTDESIHELKPLAAQRATPTLLNVSTQHWFYVDGRADSLIAQAIQAVESPLELGSTRGRMVQVIYERYRDSWEQIFSGGFPDNLEYWFKALGAARWQARPQPETRELPFEILNFALATMSSAELQQNIFTVAQSQKLSPEQWLQRQIANTDMHTFRTEWNEWQKLDDDLQESLQLVARQFGEAIAAYETSLATGDSAYDRFAARVNQSNSVEQAFDQTFARDEYEGLKHFIQSGCPQCHNGHQFTDQQFHNIGLAQIGPSLDLGRAAGLMRLQTDDFNCLVGVIPHNLQESCQELTYLKPVDNEWVGAFKTPSLRNLRVRAPYMHDGRYATLSDVLQFYNELPDEPAVGHREEVLKPIRLSPTELRQLEKFLLSLNAETATK